MPTNRALSLYSLTLCDIIRDVADKNNQNFKVVQGEKSKFARIDFAGWVYF